MPGLLRELEGDRLVVAVDPGKVAHRVWLADRERGLVGEPVTVANSRAGIEQLVGLVGGGDPVFAVEATGSLLHRAFAGELERRWPGALRIFPPSETHASRSRLAARRFKTDDRDCAALVWLARQGAGRPGIASPVEAMLAAVSYRRQLVLAPRRRCVNGCMINSTAPPRRDCRSPGGSWPRAGAGDADRTRGAGLRRRVRRPRAERPFAQDARPWPADRRDSGVLGDALEETAWRRRPTPKLRAQRLARDVERFWALREDIAFVEGQIETLAGRQRRTRS